MTLTPTLTDFIQRTSVALQGYVPRAAAEVFALLVVAGEPLTVDEIAAALQHSRAGAASSLRILQSLDVVERLPGERRVRYVLCSDPFTRILGRVAQRFRDLAAVAREAAADAPRLDQMNRTFERASEALEAVAPGGTPWRHS
jgi:DNA-binding transcriptional regulator GbsR (MarR family)